MQAVAGGSSFGPMVGERACDPFTAVISSKGKNEMRLSLRTRSRRGVVGVGVALTGVLVLASAAQAAPTVVSSDPFTQGTCKASAATSHATEVEPDTFASGATI